jgi:prevent-host-death family protein
MVSEVNAVQFRQNLGEMLNQVQYRNDSIVIKKDGKPVAALIDAELFARIRRMQDRFDELSARIAKAYADVPEEEVTAEIDALIAQERSRWPLPVVSLAASSVFGGRAELTSSCRDTFSMNWFGFCHDYGRSH